MSERRLRFPLPSRVPGSDYSKRVTSWQCSSALRWLLDECQRPGLPLPSQQALAERIEDYTRARGREFIVSEKDSGRPSKREQRISSEALPAMADNAAQFVLDTYRPDFLAQAAASGRKSKRLPVYGPEIADEIRGMTTRQAAAFLGCSPASVTRIRQRDAARLAATEPSSTTMAFVELSA